MNKEVIILIFATCVLGYLNVSFEYQNWTQPELDTGSINRATPDLNRIDIEGVKLFSLYSNFYSSIAGESEEKVVETLIETIALDELVSNAEEPMNPVDEDIVKVPPPPPPLPPAPPTIEIVDDEEEILEQLEIEDIELDKDTEIEIIEEDEDLEDETPYMIVENMPALGPCKSIRGKERHECTQMEIIKYVSKNTKYPPIAKDAGIQGTVFVYFVVGKDGNVKDVRTLRGVDPRLDKEAERVVKSLPMFDPGQQRGKNVNVQYTIPVKFVIRDDVKEEEVEETQTEEVQETQIEEVQETQTEGVQETQTEEVQEESSEPKSEKKRRGKKGRRKKK